MEASTVNFHPLVFWGIISVIIIIALCVGFWWDNRSNKNKCQHTQIKLTGVYGLWPCGRGNMTIEQCKDCDEFLRYIKFESASHTEDDKKDNPDIRIN